MIRLPERFPVNFCESKGTDHDLFSPNDHRFLTKVQYITQDDVKLILESLPKAQSKMNELRAFDRARILRAVATQVRSQHPMLALLISTEGGKPLKDAKVEVERAALTFELCAEETLRLGGETLPMERATSGIDHLSFTLRDPIGPVLAISAFNHPLNLLAHQVGCAIAGGNPVVVKPAPATPLSAFKLEKFFQEAGLPSECLLVVNGGVPEIEALASSPAFAFVSFIGSSRVGWNLRRVIAPGVRLSLEHGGQAPAIVRSDADMEKAVSALVKGSFYHAGQVCISTQRIFVHQSVHDTFIERFLDAVKKLSLGDATLETTDVGPLIRSAEVDRIRGWIDEAVGFGARVLIGNEVSGNQGQYLSPTVVAGVSRKARLMTDEVFGPVVCVNAYRDEEELLRYLNQNDSIFEGCLFTQDLSIALRMAREISSMTFVINDHSAYRVDWMPFGGHRLSGLGLGGVRYSVEEMTRLKQIIIKY